MKWAWSCTVKLLAALVASTLLAWPNLQSASLSGGSAEVNFDRAAWDSLAGDIGLARPVLTLAAFFDQDAVNARNYSQILRDPPTNAIYTGQVYELNGATVTNQEGRTAQPTTFSFTPGDPEGHTGVIGLGGISRFAVSGGGSLLYGDFTLQFDPARQARGGSGWYLKGNIPPVAPAFDLLHVQWTESGPTIQLTGDLVVSFEIANFLYATPADALRDVGDFRLSATIAQGVGGVARIATVRVIDGSLVLIAEGGTPGGTYTLQSAQSLTSIESSWTLVGTGGFDARGTCSNAVPMLPAETTRWFRLQQP